MLNLCSSSRMWEIIRYPGSGKMHLFKIEVPDYPKIIQEFAPQFKL